MWVSFAMEKNKHDKKMLAKLQREWKLTKVKKRPKGPKGPPLMGVNGGLNYKKIALKGGGD